VGDREERLVAGVPGRHDHARQQREDDRDHEPLVVDAVSDVGGGARDLAGREEAGELGLPERIEELELATLLEVVLDVQMEVLQELHAFSM
jgi:hypothetical protein